MKQCPHCKKNIPDSAKICPHCGTRLEKGYQPMKRTNTFPNYIYVILALILIFSPIISTMLFGNYFADDVLGEVSTPDKAITLGPIGEANIEKEITEYQFNSLEEFDKLVKNSDIYVKNIKKLESEIKSVTKKYGKTVMDKDYTFYVTDQNNVYSSLYYDIEVGNNEVVSLVMSYDLTGKTNSAKIDYSINGLQDFEAMKVTDDNYLMLKDIVTVINGDNQYQCFNQVGNKFNDLENDFNNRDNIGNYGIGVNDAKGDDKVSMRIFSSKDGYRLKVTYRSVANLEKLVGTE